MATGHNTITARLMEFLKGLSIIRTFPGYYGDNIIRQDQNETYLLYVICITWIFLCSYLDRSQGFSNGYLQDPIYCDKPQPKQNQFEVIIIKQHLAKHLPV